MERRTLGRTGISVSHLCLGTMTFGWTTDEKTSFAIMSEALDAGVDFFDTADMYSGWSSASWCGRTEEIMGRWFAEDRSRRDRVVLATKVRCKMSDAPGDEGLGRAHVMKAIDDSLRRLQTDRVDLYQSHWFDDQVKQDETLRAYDDLIKAGKVRAIGCSNYSAEQIAESLAICKREGLARYESLQPQYSLVERRAFEGARADLCVREQIAVIPYSPLAGGFLTGKYARGAPAPAGTRGEGSGKIAGYMRDDRNFDLLDRVAAIAKSKNRTIAQVALAWVAGARGITSAIFGANTLEQLRDALGAHDLVLSGDERGALDHASKHTVT